jgi:hypothetical protein
LGKGITFAQADSVTNAEASFSVQSLKSLLSQGVAAQTKNVLQTQSAEIRTGVNFMLKSPPCPNRSFLKRKSFSRIPYDFVQHYITVLPPLVAL